MINKTKADDLNILHRVLFDVNGQSSKIKQNVRKFNGFDFDKDSKEYEKRDELLNRAYWTVIRQQFLKVLGIDRAALGLEKEQTMGKEVTVKGILTFLTKPHDTGKAVPGPKKKKTAAKKKKRSTSKKDPSKKKVKKEKGAGDADPGSGADDSGSDQDSGAESGSEESGDEEAAEKTPTAKKEKKEKPVKKATPKNKEGAEKKKATPKKKVTTPKAPKKKSTPKKDKVPVELSTDTTDDSDDEPLIKKAKVPPTDTQLKDTIKKILEGANLEQVTMKTVCQAVYSKYPDFDLTSRKDFIKGTVKELIN